MNTDQLILRNEKQTKLVIYGLSIVVPMVVAALFSIRLDTTPLSFLPPIYATINGITSLVLIGALIAVMKSNLRLHKALIQCALILSTLFLICYVAYHITSSTTYFGDINHDGVLSQMEQSAIKTTKLIYYPLLGSHIILSIAVIPLVLITYLRGLRTEILGSGQDAYRKHKRLARVTYPIWLYVTISGVAVYAMISPYYGK